jgi:hypothetical protein
MGFLCLNPHNVLVSNELDIILNNGGLVIMECFDICKADRLADQIFDYSIESIQLIYNAPDIIDKGKVTEQELVAAMFEFTSFFTNIVDRIIFEKYGLENRNKIINIIFKNIIIKYKQLFKDHNKNYKEILENIFSEIYSEAQINYSKCSSYDNEHTSAAGRLYGERCTAMLTYLIDRLYKAFKTKKVADDFNFIYFVRRLVMEELVKWEFYKIADET